MLFAPHSRSTSITVAATQTRCVSNSSYFTLVLRYSFHPTWYIFPLRVALPGSPTDHSSTHKILRTAFVSQSNPFNMPEITAGRVCLTINAAITGIGPFMADWSDTHIFNPRWPPHAKFHNGQTMSMGVLLGLATLYYTWRSEPAPHADSIKTAAIFSSLYYIAGISAVFYPGSLAVDPEFGTGNPQIPPFVVFATIPFLAYWLEARRVSQLKVR